MISYGMAKARAMAGRDDWNECEAIKSATILWYDTEEEGYELEIENEDDLDAEDFTDLPQELIEKYTEQFRQAYDFALVGNTLMPILLSE